MRMPNNHFEAELRVPNSQMRSTFARLLKREIGARKMKSVLKPILVVATTLTTGSCASISPPWTPPCRADGGCSPNATRTRVINAFTGLNLDRVLECTSIPSDSCYSTDPDEDACLVVVSSEAVSSYIATQEAKPTRLTTSVPFAVARFSGSYKTSFTRNFSDKPEQSLSERRIYTAVDNTLAVLVLTEERCFRVEEVS